MQAFSQELVQVVVLDRQTGSPISDVRVVVSHNTTIVDEAVTNAEGIAQLLPQATSVEGIDDQAPSEFQLSTGYPNPFNQQTRVDINVPESQVLTAEVFNVLGQLVMQSSFSVTAGSYHADFNMAHLATGLYIIRFRGVEQGTVTVTRIGDRNLITSSPASGSGISLSPGNNLGPTTPKSETDSRSKQVSQQAQTEEAVHFTFKAEKKGFTTWGQTWSTDQDYTLTAQLSALHPVRIITLDEKDNMVEANLRITGDLTHKEIRTPYEAELPLGRFRAIGASDSLSFNTSFMVQERVPEVTIRASGPIDGVLLKGEEDQPAVEVSFNLDIPTLGGENSVSEVSNGLITRRVLRTEVEVSFKDDITVGQVNKFLESYDARIVSMLDRMTVYVVRIPDPGSLDELERIMEEMRKAESVFLVLESAIPDDPELHLVPEEEEKREKFPQGLINILRVDHHLAVRGHALWNLNEFLGQHDDLPTLIIGDLFGDGINTQHFSGTFETDDFATDNSHGHGYHVLGIMMASFDPVPFASQGIDDVTGLYTTDAPVRALDIRMEDLDTWPRRMNRLSTLIRDLIQEDPDARIIVNTSLNSRRYDNQALPALSWIQRVRGGFFNMAIPGRGIENRFIHFTSAGNGTDSNDILLPFEDHWTARDNSMFAHAGLSATIPMSIIGGSTVQVPGLQNTLVIENRTNERNSYANNQRPVPSCANIGSIMGGHLSGIGTSVWSYTATWPGMASGTSMSTPQVATTAMWAWTLNPSLSVNDLSRLLIRTAEKRHQNTGENQIGNCHHLYPRPVVDAYAAALYAGGTDARKWLLDVTKTGAFDNGDIQEFLDAFNTDEGTLNFSRYDLNGDGQTGGEGRDRFDLDGDGYYDMVSYESQGMEVKVHENGVRDIDILCYYAYSDLFSGNEAERDEQLFKPCGFEELVNSPVAVDDFANVLRGRSVVIDVLNNDVSPDITMPLKVYRTINPVHGTIEVVNDSTAIRYTPSAGFTSGIDHFYYRIVNAYGYTSGFAKVEVNVWGTLEPVIDLDVQALLVQPEVMLRNEIRDLILSGLTTDRLRKSYFLGAAGGIQEIQNFGGNTIRSMDLNRRGEVVGFGTDNDNTEIPFFRNEQGEMTALPVPEMFFKDGMNLDEIELESFVERLDRLNSIVTENLPDEISSSGLMANFPGPDRLKHQVSGIHGNIQSGQQEATTEGSESSATMISEVFRLSGSANSINNNGVIGGMYGYMPIIWIDEKPLSLTVELDIWGSVESVNNTGAVAGTFARESDFGLSSFIWRPEILSEAGRKKLADNSSAQTVDSYRSPAVTEKPEFIEISFHGADATWLSAINDVGIVVGYVIQESEPQMSAFIWDEKNDVRLLDSGGGLSTALDVNSIGQVVGYASKSGGEQFGAIWIDEELFDLNEFFDEPDFHIWTALQINDLGEITVIGRSTDGSVEVRLLQPKLN